MTKTRRSFAMLYVSAKLREAAMKRTVYISDASSLSWFALSLIKQTYPSKLDKPATNCNLGVDQHL